MNAANAPETPSNSTIVRSRDRLALSLLRAALRLAEAATPALAAAWAERLFRSARRFAAPARETALLAGARRCDFEAGGERLPAWSWGDGEPVLLVHGWEGRGGQMAPLAVALAQAGFRPIVFDAPGHGGAAGRVSSLPQFAAAILAGGRRFGPLAAVVGHSLGAAATSRAVSQGLAAGRLVLISPAADLDRYVAAFGRLLGTGEQTAAGLRRRLERRFAMDWSRERRPAVAAAARAPETPVLVLHDEADADTPFSDGREVAAAWRHGRLHPTRGLGHRRILRDPQVIAEVVRFVAAGRLTGARAPEPVRAGLAHTAGGAV